jgi:hypothetical protein
MKLIRAACKYALYYIGPEKLKISNNEIPPKTYRKKK